MSSTTRSRKRTQTLDSAFSESRLPSSVPRDTDVSQLEITLHQLRKTLDQREALLRELHHRSKNNLQLISSLLNLQARLANNPALFPLLESTSSRIMAIALIHDILHHADDLTHINMAEYAEDFVAHLARSRGIDHPVQCEVQADPVRLNIDHAIPWVLIINELVTNALKHAFADGQPGTVMLEMRSGPGGRCAIVVSDDGMGMSEEISIKDVHTLGLSLVRDLTAQLRGSITLDRTRGTRIAISFPSLSGEVSA